MGTVAERTSKQSVKQTRNLSVMKLEQIVCDFALAMEAVDHRRPQASSRQVATRQYRPGIGPFAEDEAVAMTAAQMRATNDATYLNARQRRYPSGSQTCDLTLGELPDWAIEVKLARVAGTTARMRTPPSRRSSRPMPMTGALSPTA